MKLHEWQDRQHLKRAANVHFKSLEAGASAEAAQAAAEREAKRIADERAKEAAIQQVMRIQRCDRGSARVILRKQGMPI